MRQKRVPFLLFPILNSTLPVPSLQKNGMKPHMIQPLPNEKIKKWEVLSTVHFGAVRIARGRKKAAVPRFWTLRATRSRPLHLAWISRSPHFGPTWTKHDMPRASDQSSDQSTVQRSTGRSPKPTSLAFGLPPASDVVRASHDVACGKLKKAFSTIHGRVKGITSSLV